MFSVIVSPVLSGLILVAAACASPANYDLPLDRSYTLRNSQPLLLESEYHRLISGRDPLSFAFPRPCVSALDSSRVCRDPFRIAYRDSAGDQDIGLSVIGAEEYRYVDQDVWATEAGLVTAGHKGPVSFYLDARAFNENADGRNWRSYDREAVDVQNSDVTGTASYLSYSRYRGNLSLDFPFGRLEVARDAVHWGPALLGNLTFSRDGVPFNQYVFTTHLGPITIRSLYGDLLAAGADKVSPDKHLYAHRYEWRPGRNWVIGISEQLIMVGLNKPYLFAPVFPLFIAKGTMHEDSNNGNIAMDAAWRLPGVGLFYGEFLLDDLESPSSLFLKDYQQNKWAALAGMHLVREVAGGQGGLVCEAVRIEPWVYTHFKEFPAQASNLDAPLGNQLGPNALDFRARAYYSRDREAAGAWALGLTAAVTWKGTGRGSTVGDTTYSAADGLSSRPFLQGAGDPAFTCLPFVSYGWRWFRLEAAWDVATHRQGYARLMATY
jgi:hypothetical protein